MAIQSPILKNQENHQDIGNELDFLVLQNIISQNKLQALSSEKVHELKSICRELINEQKRAPVLSKDYTEAKNALTALLTTLENNHDLLAKNHSKIEELRRSVDRLKEKIHHNTETISLLISRASPIISEKIDWDAVILKDAMKSAIKNFLKTA
jgi:hypothetical protein